MIDSLALNGQTMSIRDVASISRDKRKVLLSDTAIEQIKQSQKYIEDIVKTKKIVYGITTGFGALRTKIIVDQTERLQENLIISHSAGMGDMLPKDVIRASIALRINTLAKGYSGAQLENIEKLTAILNLNLLPVLLEKGSVGASGDLAPLAHMLLALMGKGEKNMILPSGEIVDANEALKKYNIEPAILKSKEGLAFTNGTNVMCGQAALLVFDALYLLEIAEITTAMAVEAIKGITAAFDERIHLARPYPGQIESAKIIRSLLEGSKIAKEQQVIFPFINKCPSEYCDSTNYFCTKCNKKIETEGLGWKGRQLNVCPHCKEEIGTVKCSQCKRDIITSIDDVQNDYSIRCAPQVHGSSRDALMYVSKQISIELNSAVDNPLVFSCKNNSEEFDVISGGNFHGEPIAMSVDFLAIALAEVGNITERRIAKLLDVNHNHGLPSFLIENSGINNGLMISQYAAAAMASENKMYASPGVVDSIPTCNNSEDHVSMGPVSTLSATKLLENVYRIEAISLLVMAQAIELRLKMEGLTVDALGVGTRKVMKCLYDKGFKLITDDSEEALYLREQKFLEIIKDPTFVETIYKECKIEPKWYDLIK